MEYMRDFVIRNEIPTCSDPNCSSTIKPDVVLFGEGLPKKFWQSSSDFPQCDLLIIMGTSLVINKN
jgi:NAD-dependent deacetylase sirtuin 2